ncbi:MAG: S53 family peptidase [Streptosporangiales bacterium]|nr:S53 family peptidase [Streptosporangiales bacterium]
MRKAIVSACAIGAAAIAAAAGSAPGAGPGRPAGAALSASAARVTVRPGVVRVGGPSSPDPLSTAYCERTYGIACYQPAQLRAAYHLPPAGAASPATGKGATIAVVDPYGSPTIARDLATFDRRFRLPAPPSLRAIAPAGRIPEYRPDGPMPSWAQETTLDVEYAHAIAPGANILVVETPASETEGVKGFPQIVAAEKYVIRHHLADVISQSFDATEETFTGYGQLAPLRSAYELAARDHVTVLASSGDNGATDMRRDGTTYYTRPVTSWPDSDPLVTAVGGTGFVPGAHDAYSPAVWNDTYDKNVASPVPSPSAAGGGRSEFFPRPRYQDNDAAVTGNARGVPDISMNAACSSVVTVYGSYGGGPGGWSLNCGTSEAAPEFAGIVALADARAGHPLGLINPVLYMLSSVRAPGIVDVTKGNNTVAFDQGGKRVTVRGFTARPGYDLASGVGTVDARYFIGELAGGDFLNRDAGG